MYLISFIRKTFFERMGLEISRFTRYYDRIIQYHPMAFDSGELLNLIRCKKVEIVNQQAQIENLREKPKERVAVLINGNFNHSFDIQGVLTDLHCSLSRSSSVFIVCFNPYLRPLFSLLKVLGLKNGEVPPTFLTMTDIRSISKLSEFEITKSQSVGLFPFEFYGIGRVFEKFLLSIPFVKSFAAMHLLVLKPIIDERTRFPSLSIVIPSRNERGNIEDSILRLPDMGAELELIYIEGHSTDGTWDEILRVQKKYTSPKLKILAFQQTGKGKSDAVRLGFSKASGELLTILDADLTMPPEDLPRFYDCYRRGTADFINGSRLVYPMEGEAMRFLNHLGNVFFAKALSIVLGSPIGDSLCGTKLMAKHDYERFVSWRKEFGEFDPFGDFELLFPAAILGLGIIDIPIRYRARTYGSTNINRFRHGLMLLKMTLVGLFRVRFA